MVSALVASCVLAGAPQAPYGVLRLSTEYCPHEELVPMWIESTSEEAVDASVSIQKLDDTGVWREFSADVLGEERYPRKAKSTRVVKGVPVRLEWRPAVSSNEGQLTTGSYRVIVTELAGGRPPAIRNIAAQFVVRDAPHCTKRGSSFAPHARAVVLAMVHEATRQVQVAPAIADCRSATWTVVRPFAPGMVDSTGWLHVRMCREGSPCRELFVDVWEGQVSESPKWGGRADGPERRLSPPSLDPKSIIPRLPGADAALFLVVSQDDSVEQPGTPKSDAWFDTDTRTWQVEPVGHVDGTQECARWVVVLRVGDLSTMRWSADLSAGSASRSP